MIWAISFIALSLVDDSSDEILQLGGTLGCIFAAIATWRWFSARERTTAQTPLEGGSSIDGTSLYDSIAELSAPRSAYLQKLAPVTEISRESLALEVLSLATAAAQFTIITTKHVADKERMSLVSQLYAPLLARSDLPESGDQLTTFVDRRTREYTNAVRALEDNDAFLALAPDAALLPYNGNSAHDIGLYFAFCCRAVGDPIVAVIGATLFGHAASLARAHVELN